MAVLLGLAVAAIYGTADFLGGHVSRRSATTAVVFGAQAVGLLLSAAVVAVDGAPAPDRTEVALSFGAGLVGVSGVGLLFRGLALGRMGVVAPLSGVLAAIIPVAWGIGQGERPSIMALVGVALAVGAIALVTRGPTEAGSTASRWRPALYGLGAGVGFGFVFVLLAEAGTTTGYWPALYARVASVPALTLVVLLARRPLLPADRTDTAGIVGSGLCDAGANLIFLAAARQGLLSLVSPVSALYPAGTVILARVVLGERLRRIQLAGVGVILVGLVLIGAG